MRPRALILLMVVLVACAPQRAPLEVLYAPYREAHRWEYRVERTGLGATYQDRITLETQPQANGTTIVNVHLLPNDQDPKVGARQQYTLDLRQMPPSLRALHTEGGQASLEPGFPWPAVQNSAGQGTATYATGFGFLRGRQITYSWKYEIQPNDRVNTDLGPLDVTRTDLEFRTNYQITNANMRLDFAPRYGLVRAEWKTIYGTTTVFTLQRFDGRAQ